MICKECNGGYLAASQEYYVDEIYASFHRRVHTLCFYIVIPSYPTFANQAPADQRLLEITTELAVRYQPEGKMAWFQL